MRSKEKETCLKHESSLNIKNNSKSRLLTNQPGVQTQGSVEEVKESCWEEGIVKRK